MQTPQFVKTFILSLYQISSESYGEISLSIKVSSCWVRSMPVVRKMPFKEEACYIEDCPKRLSFSFEMLQDLPSSSWDLECAVKLCHASKKVSGVLFFRQCKNSLCKAHITQSSLVGFFFDFSFVQMKRKSRRACRSSHISQTQVSMS